MRPATLLASLVAIATLAGAVIHSKHSPAISQSLAQKISELEREVAVLKAENLTLQSINTSTGELTLPLKFYTFVEQSLGVEFSSPLKVMKVDQDKLEEAAEYRWINQFNQAGIENRQYLFELLSILPTDSASYVKQLAMLETSIERGNLGVYDVVAKELLLHPRFNINEKDQQVELIRLLTIALLEQRYPAARELTDDAFLTRDAIIKGSAEMLARRFSNGLNEGKSPAKVALAEQQRKQTLVHDIDQFCRVDGCHYMEKLLEKKRKGIPAIYQYIPQQSSFIYYNTPFIKKKYKARKRLLSKPNERILLDTEFGQVILKALISKLSDQHSELDKELAYDSVQFTQDVNRPEYLKLKWQITWTGKEPATAFTALFNKHSQYAIADQQNNVVIITLK